MRAPLRLPLLLSVLALPRLALAAEGWPAVPRFPIQASEVSLAGDVRPRQYLGVVGRAAAWLGQETGEAELWVHPLKLAARFQIDFKIPEYVEPVRGADLARSVEIRPELATITYSHATFTVREHVLAPLREGGILVLLEVETYRPLELIVSFRAALQYAWPGSLGGQYARWDEKQSAFLLSESLRRHNAFIGSPWAASASSHPAHALPDAPSSFVIPVDPVRAARELVPIAIAAGIAPRDEVAAAYRRLIERAADLYRERREHAEALRRSTLRLTTPDPRLNLAFEWAKIGLDEQLVCNPDLGCGLVAGWGPAGDSARPGFGWFFGGDAAINSLAMSGIGMTASVAEGLRFLAKRQRADGKIPHEISQAAGRIPWFTDFPYTYSHADTTPFWLVALWRYWRATGDAALLRELWPAARDAYAWCLTTETDGDGIIENTSGGLGAIEVGEIGEGIHEDVYLASVWVKAAEAVSEMARAQGDEKTAGEAGAIHAKALASLNERYWIEAASHHAFGILRNGGTNDTLTVWPATAAAFGLLEQARGAKTLARLASHALTADWGARMLTTESRLYDPTHYNMGAVWPFVTGFLAWGHYNHGRAFAGFPLIAAVASTTLDWARGRNPELLSGAYYRPLDEAVPHQFFATSMVVSPLVAGLLGFDPDAPRARARLAPQLPPHWPELRVEGLRVGATTLDAAILQSPGSLLVRLRASGPPLRLELAPALPSGAREVRATVNGRPAPAQVASGPRDERVSLELPLSGGETVVSFHWSGGLAVGPWFAPLSPGQSDQGLRILDFTRSTSGWVLSVEGLAGRDYEVILHGERPRRIVGADVLQGRGGPPAAGITRLGVHVPEGTGRPTVVRVMLDR